MDHTKDMAFMWYCWNGSDFEVWRHTLFQCFPGHELAETILGFLKGLCMDSCGGLGLLAAGHRSGCCTAC
jgi:hypothetical protein